MKKTSLLLFVAVAAIFVQSSAQTQKIVANKIIAQVEDKIVLSNEYDEYKNRDLERGPLPECLWLERQLLEKSLVELGAKDSLVSESEIKKQIDAMVRYYDSQYEIPALAYRDINQIKQELIEPVRERLLVDKMRDKITDDVKVSPAEVKAFWQRIPADSLPYVEGKLEIKQLVIYPKPTAEAQAFVEKRLLEWKHQVETGQKKFDALARLYSQDPGSTEQGGQYAVNKNDRQWDSAWFAAIWKLKDGQVSPVIKSQFGLHVIQMVSRVGDDAIIRHILLIPTVGKAEINAAKLRLDSIRAMVVSGAMHFNDAVALYSEDEYGKSNGGSVLSPSMESYWVTIDELDKDVVIALKGMNAGSICQPQAYKDDRQRDAVRIIFLKAKTQPHIENLTDDYEYIAKQALEAKKQVVLHQWVTNHIAGYYVGVDKAFADCRNLAPFIKAASMPY